MKSGILNWINEGKVFWKGTKDWKVFSTSFDAKFGLESTFQRFFYENETIENSSQKQEDWDDGLGVIPRALILMLGNHMKAQNLRERAASERKAPFSSLFSLLNWWD